jgi:hypothetical protein
MPDNTPAPAAAAAVPAAAEAKPPAAAAPAAEAKAPETAKPPDLPSFDEQVAADLSFKKARRQADAEIETRRKAVEAENEKYKPFAPVLEHLSKGEVIDAIWALTKGKLEPKAVLALADRVAEQTAAAEVPVEDRVKAALEADRAAQAEKTRLADEAKANEGKQSWEADFGAYIAASVTGTKDHPGFLKANEKDFPLCVAWRDKLPIADIETEVKRRLAAHESVEARDVFKVFEDRFQADIDRTPFGKRPEPAAERNFETEEQEYFAARAANKPQAAKVTTVAEEPYTVSSRDFVPPPGKDFDEAVKEHLARLDRDRRTRARF